MSLWAVSLFAFLWTAAPYATLLSISNSSAASISNYYQDFAACSCDLTPSLCDNYCCCDAQCVNHSSHRLQQVRGLQPISVLPHLLPSKSPVGSPLKALAPSLILPAYTTPIGELLATTISQFLPVFPLLLLIDCTIVHIKLLFWPFRSKFSTGCHSQYTFTGKQLHCITSIIQSSNQYLKTSSTSYLFVPLPGVGGVCTPGLVNLTSSGTYTCRMVPTA